MNEKLLEYWRNPKDGLNEPMMYLRPIGWLRSVQLYRIISELIPVFEQPKILEIGSNIGRNLMILKFGNYTNLSGIEVSEEAIALMRKVFPTSNNKITTYLGPVEELIHTLKTDEFDIIFTMAVLEHLPLESVHVFKQMVRVTRKYLVTIEDERCTSWRHFPRRYDKVFKKLGLKQIRVIKRIDGLSSAFVCRIFKKE